MTATSLLKEHRQGAGVIFPEVAFCAHTPPYTHTPHTHIGAVRESAALAFQSILAFSSPLHPWSGYLFCLVLYLSRTQQNFYQARWVRGKGGVMGVGCKSASELLEKARQLPCRLLGTVDKELGSALP